MLCIWRGCQFSCPSLTSSVSAVQNVEAFYVGADIYTHTHQKIPQCLWMAHLPRPLIAHRGPHANLDTQMDMHTVCLFVCLSVCLSHAHILKHTHILPQHHLHNTTILSSSPTIWSPINPCWVHSIIFSPVWHLPLIPLPINWYSGHHVSAFCWGTPYRGSVQCSVCLQIPNIYSWVHTHTQIHTRTHVCMVMGPNV